jgi:hypothetical protein
LRVLACVWARDVDASLPIAQSRRCACAASGPTGSGSFCGSHRRLISTRMACSPVRRVRPSRISTARRGIRGGAFALQLGNVHAAAWVSGRHRWCTEHVGFTLPCSKRADRHAHRTSIRSQVIAHTSTALSWVSATRSWCCSSSERSVLAPLQQQQLEVLELWCGYSTSPRIPCLFDGGVVMGEVGCGNKGAGVRGMKRRELVECSKHGDLP